MPNIYVQVRMPHDNDLPSDAVMNTFHFTGVDDVQDMCEAIRDRLQAFWNDTADGAADELKNYYSSEINITGTRMRAYDLSDSEPRAPVFDESLSISSTTLASSVNLPGEVACCASYAAAVESGVPAARLRGRLFLGPLNAGSMVSPSDAPARPSGSFRTAIGLSMKELASANTLGARWVVHSRAGNLNNEVVRGWVDDAWDTQRRRGVAATGRYTWEVEI